MLEFTWPAAISERWQCRMRKSVTSMPESGPAERKLIGQRTGFRHQTRSCRRTAVLSAGLIVLLATTAAAAQASPNYKVKPLALPGASGSVTLDYIAYDSASQRLWVPAGNTGRVDVIDATSDRVQAIGGFPVANVELRGKPRKMGPSSVAVGEGVAYVGSRANSEVCAIDGRTLKRGDCIGFAPASGGMAAAPDGLIYIKATRELWGTSGAPPIGVSAPDHSIKIFSASPPGHLAPAGKVALPASAEGYAVDNGRGLFYTNLEETGQTVAIDVKKRAIVSTWRSCDDPSGVAVDTRRRFVFVACSDRVMVLDTRRGGRMVGSLAAGAGVDNFDYSELTGLLYVASAEAAHLTIAHIDDLGKPRTLAIVPTTKGTRSVVAGGGGSAYLIDPLNGNILKVEPVTP
jgi:DNA-binding beta-propeller fold protein YncE